MKQYKPIITWSIDIFLAISICLISYFLISFYEKAQYIDIGYFDWMVQAFRVKLLMTYGFTSWIHIWSNGINVWQTYQFIPHLITIGIIDLFHLAIPRAMIVLTIILFIGVRLEMYVILRLLKFSPVASFSASLLSLTISEYWGGIRDYSLQFAPFFFPAILFLWILFYNKRIKYLFPFIAGLCFYVHPELGFYAFGLWLVSLFVSSKKVFSVQTLIELIFFLIGSSFFLYPLLFPDAYHYHNPYYETQSFLSLELLNSAQFGLSVSLLFTFVLSFIKLFTSTSTNRNWIKVLTLYNLVFLFLVICSTQINLPTLLALSQFTRGTMLLGISICFVSAALVDDILTKWPKIFRFILAFLLTYAFVEAVWVCSVYSPGTVKTFEDPVAKYIQQTGNQDIGKSRIWSSAIDLTSYNFTNTTRMDTSYMPELDSNQLSERLVGLILYTSYQNEAPVSSINRLSDYFKLSGTKYIFLDKTSPFTMTLLDRSLGLNYRDLGQVSLNDGIYNVFQVPWQPRDAELINPTDINVLNHFPFNLTFQSNNDYVLLDQYVNQFVPIIYSPLNDVLPVSYPTQDGISIRIPANPISNVVFLDESYSADWEGTFNNTPVQIVPSGPNFMKIVFASKNNKFGGTLYLKHSWPRVMIYLGILILITPFLLLFYNTFKFAITRYKTYKNKKTT